MTGFGRKVKIFISKEPADMRGSYDTLASKTKGILAKDPFSGHLFVFVNRRRTSCKCLYYDGTGFVIIAKRLDRGRFSKINPYYQRELIFTQAEFALFFEGAQLNKRFVESPPQVRAQGQHFH